MFRAFYPTYHHVPLTSSIFMANGPLTDEICTILVSHSQSPSTNSFQPLWLWDEWSIAHLLLALLNAPRVLWLAEIRVLTATFVCVGMLDFPLRTLARFTSHLANCINKFTGYLCSTASTHEWEVSVDVFNTNFLISLCHPQQCKKPSRPFVVGIRIAARCRPIVCR